MTRNPVTLLPEEYKNLEQALIEQLPVGASILFLSLVGSRAWGMVGPDSDYDVKAIYVYPMSGYLSVNSRERVVNCRLDTAGIMLDDTKLSVECKDWSEFCREFSLQKVSSLEVLSGYQWDCDGKLGDKPWAPGLLHSCGLRLAECPALRYAKSFEGMVKEHVGRYVPGSTTWELKPLLHSIRALVMCRYFSFSAGNFPINLTQIKGLSPSGPVGDTIHPEELRAWNDLLEARKHGTHYRAYSKELWTDKIVEFYDQYMADGGISLPPPPNHLPFSTLFQQYLPY